MSAETVRHLVLGEHAGEVEEPGLAEEVGQLLGGRRPGRSPRCRSSGRAVAVEEVDRRRVVWAGAVVEQRAQHHPPVEEVVEATPLLAGGRRR